MWLRLGVAQATGVPGKDCDGRTGGGNIQVRQPAPDTLIFRMSALAKAGCNPFGPAVANFDFQLSQCFTVVYDGPQPRPAVLQIQGYAFGLLRSPKKGSAALAGACASLKGGDEAGPVLASFCLPTRAVGPGQNESVYLRSERLCVPAPPGCYTLDQSFHISATGSKYGFPGYGPSADFSLGGEPMAAFGNNRDPFEGVTRRDFGFFVVVKVVPAGGPEDHAGMPPPRPAEGKDKAKRKEGGE